MIKQLQGIHFFTQINELHWVKYFSVILLFLCPFSSTGKSQDASPSAGTSKATATSTVRPIDFSDASALRTRRDNLDASSARHLEDGDIESALAVQLELVSVIGAMEGNSHWKVKMSKCGASELEYVSKLTKEQRNSYLSAWKNLREGTQKLYLYEYDKAEVLLKEALKEYTLVLEENSLAEGSVLRTLGTLYIMKEDRDKALPCLIHSAAITKESVGEDHLNYATALELIGSAHLVVQDYDRAEPYIRDSIACHRKTSGAKTLNYSGAIQKLVQIMIHKDKLPEAEALCLQAISIEKEIKGESSCLMASLFSNLGDIEFCYGEYEASAANFQRSLSLFEKMRLPLSHPTIPDILDRYSKSLKRLDRLQEAEKLEARANSIREQQSRLTSGPKKKLR